MLNFALYSKVDIKSNINYIYVFITNLQFYIFSYIYEFLKFGPQKTLFQILRFLSCCRLIIKTRHTLNILAKNLYK